MTFILGLAGKARSGKDTVADYLVKSYGFVKFAFSDALYHEVQQAYNLPDQSLLRDAGTKDTPTDAMVLRKCSDDEFALVARSVIARENPDTFFIVEDLPLSPRQVLQWWGTEYRREQDPYYWLKKSDEFLADVAKSVAYPEHCPQLFVNTTVRFHNERQWIRGHGGNVWHLRRDGIDSVAAHVSETELEVKLGEREIWNNDSIERLCMAVDLMFRTNAKFIKVEPMAATKMDEQVADEVGAP